MTATPYIGAIIAIAAWGSFATPLKGEAVVKSNIHPVIFQCYVALGVSLSSFFLLIGHPKAITPGGFVLNGIGSALIWNFGNMAAMGAVQCNGIAVAQGMWAPMIAFTSFIWNVAAFHTKPNNLGLTILGLIIMSAGCVIMAIVAGQNNNQDSHRNSSTTRLSNNLDVPLIRDDSDSQKVQLPDGVQMLEVDQGGASRQNNKKDRFTLGVILTVATGLLSGSVFVPLELTSAEVRDGLNSLRFAFSQGITTGPCMCFQAPFVLAILHLIQSANAKRAKTELRKLDSDLYYEQEDEGGDVASSSWLPPLHLKTCVLPGIAAGAIWNLGNAMAILATLPPLTTVGYSLTQAAMLIACLWGILVFKEITGKRNILLFAVGACVTMTGLVITALFGSS